MSAWYRESAAIQKYHLALHFCAHKYLIWRLLSKLVDVDVQARWRNGIIILIDNQALEISSFLIEMMHLRQSPTSICFKEMLMAAFCFLNKMKWHCMSLRRVRCQWPGLHAAIMPTRHLPTLAGKHFIFHGAS